MNSHQRLHAEFSSGLDETQPHIMLHPIWSPTDGAHLWGRGKKTPPHQMAQNKGKIYRFWLLALLDE